MILRTALFILYIALSAFGLFKLKTAPFGLNMEFALGAACYVGGFGLWLLILKNNPLSLAFPVAAGGLVVATQLIGYWMLHESFTSLKVAGVSMIVAGILVVFYQGSV